MMYWRVDRCCNKSLVIWNVYKRPLIINIIVETSASPLFTTDHIQPEFSSVSILLDDNKQKRDETSTQWERYPTPIQNKIMILSVSKMNENDAWIQPKYTRSPPATNLLPTSGDSRTTAWHRVWRHRETSYAWVNTGTGRHRLKRLHSTGSAIAEYRSNMTNTLVPP